MLYFKFISPIMLFMLIGCAYAQPLSIAPELNRVELDVEFLKSTFDHSRCFGEDWRMRFCLRALNDMIRFVASQDVQLLHVSQLNTDWEVFTPTDGKAYFQYGNLVVAKLSASALSAMNVGILKNFRYGIDFNKSMFNRFKEMAVGEITNDDLRTAFQFVINQVHSKEEVTALAAFYYSAELKEAFNDPYARVVPNHALSQTAERMNSFHWFGGKLVASRIRPNSILDQAGLYVGMYLESAGNEKFTPTNMSAVFSKLEKDHSLRMIYRGPRGERIERGFDKSSPIAGVYHYKMDVHGRKISILEIPSFYVEDICKKTREAILEINRSATQGLVIDLRDNSGGIIDNLECIAGLIFGKNLFMGWDKLIPGTFEYETMRKRRSEVLEHRTSEEKALAPSVEVSFLVNARSGSSSELFAGFGKFGFDNVWVIGQRTFGKGIGQSSWPAIKTNGEEIAELQVIATQTKFYLPNGYTYHLQGIEPDFVIETPLKMFPQDPYVERLVDIFGEGFRMDVGNSDTPKSYRNPSREAVKKLMDKCLQRLKKKPMPEGTPLWRWFQDQQLREAALVSACQINLQK